MPAPWFFLSHARRDNLGEALLKRFYVELSRNVGEAAGLPANLSERDIGFFDEEGIEAGEQWPAVLADALQASQVLLCVYSLGYFSSEYCGKEFAVFRSRMAAFATANNAKPPPLMLPVLWERPDRLPKTLPAAMNDIQYSHADFGTTYAIEGLSLVSRLNKYGDDYKEFLFKFARRLVDMAKAHPLPPLEHCLRLKDVASAFDAPPGASAVATNGDSELENLGPSVVHFAFVAGKPGEFQGVRTKVDAYGAYGGRWWRPYAPDVDTEAGFMTQRVATDERLQHEVMRIGADLVQKLRKADDSNTIVILLIDPWTLRVQSYQEYMRQYDTYNLVNCAAVVLWNDRDDESQRRRTELLDTINRTFPNNVISRNPQLRIAVKSEEDLRRELAAAISGVRKRLAERANLLRPIGPGDNPPLPRLSGPC